MGMTLSFKLSTRSNGGLFLDKEHGIWHQLYFEVWHFSYKKVKEPNTPLVYMPKPPFISSELRQFIQTKNLNS